MKLQFEFDQVSSTGDIKEKIEKKLAALEKYLVNVRQDFHRGLVRVMKGERWGYRVKVEIDLPAKTIVAEGRAESLLDAVDEAYNRIARRIRDYFEKMKERK